MKNFILASIIICFISSCKSPGQFSHSETKQMKEIYVHSFKMIYFKKMLLAGFRNSNEIRSVLNEDHSNFSEIILTMEDYLFIDSIVASDQAKIIADSSYSINKRAEGAVGKRVLKFALNRYESKWLNNIAKKRAKSYTHVDMFIAK